MKKVVHIISELNVGGAENQLSLILPELQEDFENHVVCLWGQGSFGKKLEEKNIPVHYLMAAGLLDPRILVRLYRKLRSLKPDISIGYLFHADIYNRFISKLLKIPVIISSQRSSYVGRSYAKVFENLTSFGVDHYHTLTQVAKNQIIKTHRRKTDEITVIPNAVKSQTTHSQKEGQIVRFVCVASLKKGKGHALLLNAFNKLYEKNKDAELYIIGDGELRSELEKQVTNSPSKNAIHFLGKQTNIHEHLQNADVFVLPTYGEGMSNALLEAMAAGLACITSDIPVNKEIIVHKKTGVLFSVGKQDGLLESMELLAHNQHLRNSLGNAAQAYTSKYHSVSIVKNQWTNLLSQLS